MAELAAVVTIAGTAAIKRELRLPRSGWRQPSALTGILAAAGIISYFRATHRGLLAVTVGLSTLYRVVAIVLAWRLAGGQLTKVEIAGLGLAAASVGLIAVGGVG